MSVAFLIFIQMKIKYHILFFFFSSLLLTANAQKLKPEYSKVLDENSGENSAWINYEVIGENVYYSIYTSHILEVLMAYKLGLSNL